MSLLSTLSENSTLIYGIGLVALVTILGIEIFKRRKPSPNQVIDITRHEYLRGYRIVERGGWVRGHGYGTREELEAGLKSKAAKLGGNAVIKFYWNSSPRGRNDQFRGEGEAVLVEENGTKTKTPAPKNKARIRKDTPIYVDGSNLIYWTKDHRIDTHPLAVLCGKLRDDSVDFLVFFDANIKYLLSEAGGQVTPRDRSTRDLERVFGLFAEEITIVPAGSPADDFILQRAHISKGMVISNDRYKDYFETYPWLGNAKRVHRGYVDQGNLYIPTLSLKIPVSG